MENNAALFARLAETALEKGAYKASVVEVEKVETDASFRSLCESNVCGKYGRCWMCPPDVGEIDTLMAELRSYDYALVYQTVGMLEDSYDIEGMGEAAQKHNALTQVLMNAYAAESFSRKLHLSAGGCHICPTCAKLENQPCRFPERAVPPLEGYGVNVSRLASVSGMKYTNGQNTVTYFGALFFSL